MACPNFKKGLKMASGPIGFKWKNNLLFSTGLSYIGVHVQWLTKLSQGEGHLYSQSHSTSRSEEKVKVWIQKL
jgi:hypothetical protein